MSTELATRESSAVDIAADNTTLRKIAEKGDLSGLNWNERWAYMLDVCRSAGLDPMTRPFDFLEDKGKVSLYVNKTGTAQLRDKHRVSIYDLQETTRDGLLTVKAYARLPNGREDVDYGVVALVKDEWAYDKQTNKRAPTGRKTALSGDDLANAIKKATTQAKRRVTLSICGLGFLDASETEDVPYSRTLAATEVERRLQITEVTDAGVSGGYVAGASIHQTLEAPASPSPLVHEKTTRDGTVVDTMTGVILKDAPPKAESKAEFNDAINRWLELTGNPLTKPSMNLLGEAAGITRQKWNDEDKATIVAYVASLPADAVVDAEVVSTDDDFSF